MQLARAFLDRSGFALDVKRAEERLRRTGDVLKVRHQLDYEMDGEPVVWFLVILPDSSAKKGKLLEATHRVSYGLESEIEPQGKWGVYPHHHYRSKSEEEALQEPAWA